MLKAVMQNNNTQLSYFLIHTSRTLLINPVNADAKENSKVARFLSMQ